MHHHPFPSEHFLPLFVAYGAAEDGKKGSLMHDFPRYWLNLNCTVEVEAKAKELAIIKLKNDIKRKVFQDSI